MHKSLRLKHMPTQHTQIHPTLLRMYLMDSRPHNDRSANGHCHQRRNVYMTLGQETPTPPDWVIRARLSKELTHSRVGNTALRNFDPKIHPLMSLRRSTYGLTLTLVVFKTLCISFSQQRSNCDPS
ncbi:uncharacterized protein LOC117143848 [Drosophila mauritiana]|uniref:Uncharacterized protein LOC117143848 n=1 Tax=Drosophila mauritiana TaxID=7226 RepID=A0A6P8K896_DROMA|nr:uncharacterized protein LOC117143848 [Drosophila mauritiana]